MKIRMTDTFVGTLEDFVKERDLQNKCLRWWYGDGEEAWYGYFRHIIVLPDNSVMIGTSLAEDGGDGYIEYYPLSKFVTIAYSDRDNDEEGAD